MSAIKNLGNLSVQEINYELQNGGKFVIFQYSISVLVMTFKRPSGVYFLRAGESHWGKSLPFTIISLLFGWWGLPWGLIYTPMAIATNLGGGKDVTREVISAMNKN